MKINIIPIELGQLRKGIPNSCQKIYQYIRPFLGGSDVVYHHQPRIRWENNIQERHRNIMCQSRLLSDSIKEQLNQNHYVMNIGGDHTIAMGTIRGFLDYCHDKFPRKTRKVIWIDAHADTNTRDKSFSKNMHGMPVSFLTGLDSDPFVYPINNTLKWYEIIYIGVRDTDSYENDVLKTHRVSVFPQIKNHEKEILDTVGKDNLVHISFDVDSLDPSIMPCTGTRASNGLFLNETISLIKEITKRNTLLSTDITEFNEEANECTEEEKNVSWNTLKQIIMEFMNLKDERPHK